LILRLDELNGLRELRLGNTEVDETVKRGVSQVVSRRVKGKWTNVEKALLKSSKNAFSSLAYFSAQGRKAWRYEVDQSPVFESRRRGESEKRTLSVVRAMSVRSIMRLLSDLFSN
jgi:hypothetical protein